VDTTVTTEWAFNFFHSLIKRCRIYHG